ncbi:MAG: tyrosine--tRNA ligase [Alphaproteobacteria bacterium]
MTEPRSEFLRTLQARGFIHQCTDMEALDHVALKAPMVAYVGYDCTAPSLHVGNLVSIMLLRWFQRCGHKPMVLMGGGTTKVGDPTGKEEMRKILSDEQIAENMAGIKAAFSNFLEFGDGPTDAVMVNNADWLDDLNYMEFLRDYGRHFSVNRMLSQDSVKLRLEREQPMSFLEFNYMVLQSYDFLELSRRYNCVAQMGGSDQWGNIVNGVELGRRIDGTQLFGLTTPLIALASGAKMGKSAKGAVWLNAEMKSAYDYWQFWRNSDDADVARFLRLFTEMPLDDIAAATAEGGDINEAKKLLANAATTLCHGANAARNAAETARKTFEDGAIGDSLPVIGVSRAELDAGLPAFEALQRAGLCTSGGEARRLIKGGGGRVNDTPFANETQLVSAADLNADGVIKLSAGKKRHALLRAE